MEEVSTPARTGLRGRPCQACGLPCQRMVDSYMAIIDVVTAGASCACIERRRTVGANQGSKVDDCKVRRPCTDMLPASPPQRADSGARGGRSAAAHAIVFGPQTKNSWP